MNQDKALLKQLTELLTKGNAHATFEQAIQNLTIDQLSIKPNNLPYNIWMLVEHLRIAQADIIEFSTNPNYKDLNWPNDYWPTNEAPADEEEWQNCIQQIKQDRDRFIDLLHVPTADLYTPFTHGTGQNLLREALLIADHNSYHTGQIVLIRKLLGIW